jgi:hypothetical protein
MNECHYPFVAGVMGHRGINRTAAFPASATCGVSRVIEDVISLVVIFGGVSEQNIVKFPRCAPTVLAPIQVDGAGILAV